MHDHPNVLLITTDQQHHRAIGALDDSFSTPNLDRLAADGTLFTGCHSTHPQCSPARSSLFSGQFPHQTGMYTLPGWSPRPLDPSCPSVARPFRAAGYETTYVGKWHLGRDNVREFGWTVTENVHETSNPPEGTPTDTTTRDRAMEYLSEYDAASPFFLTVSFNLPHPGFYEDLAFADRYDRDSISVPESFDDDLDDKPAFHRRRRSDMALTEDDVRDIRYKYRTMTSRVDDHVGRVIDALEERGLRDETVVVFTSDHGDMQGAHGLSHKGVFAYDDILRVPLIVDVPGRRSNRDRISDLVSLASIPATLLDAARLSTDEVASDSLLPAFERSDPPDDEMVFFEHKYAHWGEHPYRGVRTRDWKYVDYLTDSTDELYHMSEDPHEMDNLSGDPAHAATEDRLKDLVTRWWERSDGDVAEWTEPV